MSRGESIVSNLIQSTMLEDYSLPLYRITFKSIIRIKNNDRLGLELKDIQKQSQMLNHSSPHKNKPNKLWVKIKGF